MCRILKLSTLAFSLLIGYFAEAYESRFHQPPFKTIGSESAPQGGTFRIAMIGQLGTLHPIKTRSPVAELIRSLVVDSPMIWDPSANKYWPGLIQRVETIEPNKKYRLTLREGVQFHNGKPLTAEDVEFSFNAALNPEFNAGHRAPYFDKIRSVKAENKSNVIVRFQKPYFLNMDVLLGQMNPIVPKESYENPLRKVDRVMIGSGPYRLGKVGRSTVTLLRNKKWWGNNLNYLKGRYNFEKIVVKLVSSEKEAMGLIQTGKADYYHPVSHGFFFRKSFRKKVGKVAKFVDVENQMAKPYSFLTFNLKNPMFSDKRVRLALAKLMNRELINEKFRAGASELASGPWSRNSEYANPKVAPIQFDPEGAVDLLNEAGWLDKDLDGIREKIIDGKKVQLAFNIFLPNQTVEKYFLLYQEDLNRAGVAMAVRDIDMKSLLKAIAADKFEAVSLGWGRGQVDIDPKQIWHSESVKSGGSNFIGYKNTKVDQLIEKGRYTINKAQRVKIYQEVYKLIAQDVPYLFMFHDFKEFYLINSRIGGPSKTFAYDIGWEYFWSKK
jgi:microcin C transport system substrate-binding protein